MSNVSGLNLRRSVYRELARRRQAQGQDRGYIEAVNTGTASTSLTDAVQLLSTRYSSQQFQDWRALVTSGNRWGSMSNGTVLTTTTGLLTVSPAFSGALANADTLELISPELPHPDNVCEAIDKALTTKCTRWRLAPLTWAQDGDFLYDADGDATPTYWTGSSATATVDNDRTGQNRISERILRVLNSGANGYAAQTINRTMGAASGGQASDWFFWAVVQADVGTAAPILYDLTNSAALTLSGKNTSWTGEAPQIIKVVANAPATCEQISLRLGNSGASDDSYWSDVIIYQSTAREFILPARITSTSQVGRFVEVVGEDWGAQYIRELEVQPDLYEVGGRGVRAVFQEPLVNRAVFFEEFAYSTALWSTYNTVAGRAAGDALTTDLNPEYVKYAALDLLYPGEYERQFRKWHRQEGAKHGVRWHRRGPSEVSA